MRCCGARRAASRGLCATAEGSQFENRNVQRFRGGLVFKAHRLCVSLNSRLGSNKEEKKTAEGGEGAEVRWTGGSRDARRKFKQHVSQKAPG